MRGKKNKNTFRIPSLPTPPWLSLETTQAPLQILLPDQSMKKAALLWPAPCHWCLCPWPTSEIWSPSHPLCLVSIWSSQGSQPSSHLCHLPLLPSSVCTLQNKQQKLIQGCLLIFLLITPRFVPSATSLFQPGPPSSQIYSAHNAKELIKSNLSAPSLASAVPYLVSSKGCSLPASSHCLYYGAHQIKMKSTIN